MHFSGDFGFCAYVSVPEQGPPHLGLYRTDDAGTSWGSRAAAGVQLVDGDVLGAVVVSPWFEEDETVYVQVGRGLFASEDGGETFSLADPLAGSGLSWRNLSPFVEELGGNPSLAFAFANDDVSALVRPPLHQIVPGSPFSDRFFLVSPEARSAEGARAVAVEVDSSDPQRPRARTLVFGCDANLVCQQQLHAFPWGPIPIRAWRLPSAGGDDVVVLVLSEPAKDGPAVWWSHDGGATFAEWTAVDRIVRRVPVGAQVEVGVTGTVGERLYLRVSRSLGLDPEDRREQAVPRDRIFSSRDGSAWRLTARSGGGNGVGTIPWTRFPISFDPGYVSLHSSGRLFAIAGTSGTQGEYDGIYCSADGGRSWSKTCSE
ncbi:MAG TPA: hypothetical protein VEV43_08430 [Actinomycetota bacterium]|nr:hypothetical protein [Actinomycetota bacterium]